MFRPEISALNVFGCGLVAVVELYGLTNERADSKTEERETGDPAMPVVLACKDGGERGKKDVEVRVRDGDVQRHGEADSRASEHLGRSNNGKPEQFLGT